MDEIEEMILKMNNDEKKNEEEDNLRVIISNINGKDCEQTDHIRYLGFYFNCRGSFKNMINIVCNKNNANFAIIAKATKMYGLTSIAIWRLGSVRD